MTYKTSTSNRPVSILIYRCLTIAALSVTAFANAASAAGEATFKAKCVGCHGVDGSGNTAMGKKFKLRDLRSADVQKKSDEDLQEIIAKGKPPMPGFSKSVDAAGVQELVVYLRSIATK
jgi:mono/diheme cytochrome c family protein